MDGWINEAFQEAMDNEITETFGIDADELTEVVLKGSAAAYAEAHSMGCDFTKKFAPFVDAHDMDFAELLAYMFYAGLYVGVNRGKEDGE